MKFVVVLFAFVAIISADPIPTGISDNKIGDIITADVDFNVVISSNVDQTIVNVLAALLNQQAAVVQDGGDDHSHGHDTQAAPQPALDISKLLTPENIEKAKSMLATLGKKQE